MNTNFNKAAEEGGLPAPQEMFHHYGLSAEEVAQLLSAGLKPEEIAGADDVQRDRVGELVRWFARFSQGHANPKWATRHACELAYFIATNGINRHIDLETVRNAAVKEGVNITSEERGSLERIGFATPRVPDDRASCQVASVNVQTWMHRLGPDYNDSKEATAHEIAMEAEITELREALARQVANKVEIDLSSLKRYYRSDTNMEHTRKSGGWVKFKDVRELLATPPATTGASIRSAEFYNLVLDISRCFKEGESTLPATDRLIAHIDQYKGSVGASTVLTDEQVEIVAEIIYKRMPADATGDPKQYPWVKRGNSHKQEEARSAAREVLKKLQVAVQAGQVAVPDDVEKDAARYRWIRERMAVEDVPSEHPAWSSPTEVENKKFDAGVDAAMKNSPAKESK